MLPRDWMDRAIERCEGLHPAVRLKPCDECKVNTPVDVAGTPNAVEEAVEEELALREVNATFPTDGDWHIDAKLSGTAAVIIGKEIARWFKEQNAPNYVEMKMMDRDTHEVYILTVQRAAGKTPHEKRVEAEAQLAAARTQAFAEVRRVGFSADDVKFLRYEAQYARDQHGDLIAESFDFDGLANRIEALLAALSSEGK